jgi:hypothetical protein
VSEQQKTESQLRDEALKASYQHAQKVLRERHLDEFNAIRQEEAKRLGYDWAPPKTEEQKAAEQVAALVEKFPHLAEQIKAGQQPVRVPVSEPVPEPVSEEPEGTGPVSI